MQDHRGTQDSTQSATLFCTRGDRFNPLTKSTPSPQPPTELTREVTALRRVQRVRTLRETRRPVNNYPSNSPPRDPAKASPSIAPLKQNSTLTLSPTATANLQRALGGSIARSTARKYDGAIRDFNLFCDSESIPPEHRLPASELLLSAFAARYVGLHADSTIRNSLLGVRSWHVEQGFDWQGGPQLARVLRAARLLAPRSSKRPPRPPATAQLVAKIVIGLNLTNPFDAATAAIITTALWGMARLGELIPDTNCPKDTSFFPTRQDLGPLSSSRKSRTIHLPYTKTTQVDGGTLIITNQSGLANPLPLLENHLAVNKPRPEDPLFAYRTDSGKLGFISKKRLMRRCHEILGEESSENLTGHCFRIGGTYEMLRAGVSPDIVQKMGRWKSDVFLRYWRDEQHLGELHVSNVHTLPNLRK